MVERVGILARQYGVGEALPSNLRHEIGKAVGVVQGIVACGAIVEPKDLFVKVAI